MNETAEANVLSPGFIFFGANLSFTLLTLDLSDQRDHIKTMKTARIKIEKNRSHTIIHNSLCSNVHGVYNVTIEPGSEVFVYHYNQKEWIGKFRVMITNDKQVSINVDGHGQTFPIENETEYVKRPFEKPTQVPNHNRSTYIPSEPSEEKKNDFPASWTIPSPKNHSFDTHRSNYFSNSLSY